MRGPERTLQPTWNVLLEISTAAAASPRTSSSCVGPDSPPEALEAVVRSLTHLCKDVGGVAETAILTGYSRRQFRSHLCSTPPMKRIDEIRRIWSIGPMCCDSIGPASLYLRSHTLPQFTAAELLIRACGHNMAMIILEFHSKSIIFKLYDRLASCTFNAGKEIEPPPT